VRDTGLTAADAWAIADDRSTWRALRPIAGYAQQWVSEWVLGLNKYAVQYVILRPSKITILVQNFVEISNVTQIVLNAVILRGRLISVCYIRKYVIILEGIFPLTSTRPKYCRDVSPASPACWPGLKKTSFFKKKRFLGFGFLGFFKVFKGF